jgi:membrane-bound serine protease (ClpP class)
LLLFETPDMALRVSRPLIAGVAAAVAVVAGFLTLLVVRSARAPVTTGSEGMLAVRGVARSPLAPAGKVFVRGELWNAVAEGAVAAGQSVEVVGQDGLTLRVRAVAGDAPAAGGGAPTGG